MTAKRKFRRGRQMQDLPHAYCSLMPLMAAGLLGTCVAGNLWARPAVALPARYEVPVPSNQSGRPFVFSGSVSGGAPEYSGANGENMRIRQTTQTLGLNWESFNIGKDATVTFIQPNANSRVLNRIWDLDPSVINGKLNANGQVYLLNQNGILFGENAQVNVGGLAASALGFTSNALLSKGIPDAKGESLTLNWDRIRQSDGASLDPSVGFVAVDAGAKIVTPSGGKVVLLAPATVENLGLIQTGGAKAGEVILAAGGKVVLTAPDDPDLRGILVESTPVVVNGITTSSSVLNQGGNTDQGRGIESGSVTLAAMAVNQQGRVNATRAVNLNGEIMLVSGRNDSATVNLNLGNAQARVDWTSQHSGSGKQTVNVVQAESVQEIDWSSGFKVDKNQDFVFRQPGAGSVVYNYVYDPDHFSSTAGRSVIDGGLSANGQLYLINEKGIRFTGNADVRAANFVASALGLNPAIVDTGLLGQPLTNKRAFYLNKAQTVVADAADLPAARTAALAQFRESVVTVEKGASIRTGENGIAMLLGGQVTNSGSIVTPGGQTVLAAGADVYLKPPSSQSFRGYAAEVNPLYIVQGWNGNAWLALSRGNDANRVVNNGSVTSSFGDISLVGHEIVQNGSLTASTSLNRNGSIHLHARDMLTTSGLTTANDGEPPTSQGDVGQVGGKITFAAGSRTEVKLDALDGRQGKYGSDGVFYKTDAKGDFLLDKKGKRIAWDEITLTATQAFTPSTIDAAAASIHVQGKSGDEAGAELVANGGKIRLLAQEGFSFLSDIFSSSYDPQAFQPGQDSRPAAGAGIFIGSGAKLDVSGAVVNKKVGDQFIGVELRGDEFAGNPLQRGGALRGKTVYVDVRDRVKIADLSGYLGKVGQNLGERSATGGSISLRSEGSVIVKQDAVLDVSGGRVNYAGGKVTESYVYTASGYLSRLNDVPADVRAAGSIDVTREVEGYSEGRSAGSIELSGNSLAVDGTLRAITHRGEYQRFVGDPAGDRTTIPLGGKLIIRDAGQHYGSLDSGQVRFVNGASRTAQNLAFGDQAGQRLDLSTDLLKNGFSRFDIRSDGRAELDRNVALNLAPGGEFVLNARQVVIDGDISAAGGKIRIGTRDPGTAALPAGSDVDSVSLNVGKTARLSTAGNWANDYLASRVEDYALSAAKGGSIALESAGDLNIAKGAVLDVSGGARVRSDASLEAGNAGSIRLASGRYGVSDAEQNASSIFLDGELRGYSLARGGRLEVESSQIRIGKTVADVGSGLSRDQRYDSGRHGAAFDGAFFSRGGFNDFSLIAGSDLANERQVVNLGNSGRLTVANGTVIAPDPQSWYLDLASGYQYKASGSNLAGFADLQRLNPDLREAPTSVSLHADRDLSIGTGSRIEASTGGSIALSSHSGNIKVDGTLQALAGSISLARTGGRGGVDYQEGLQSRGILLGSNSRLLAHGTTRLDQDTLAQLDGGKTAEQLRSEEKYRGEVLAGGSVRIDAGNGYVATREGSVIDVSGSSDRLNAPIASGSTISYANRELGSAGGTVQMAAGAGMLIDGSFKAAGAKGMTGGTFSLRFDRGAYLWFINPNSPPPAAVTGDRDLVLYESSGGHANLWPGSFDFPADTYNGKTRLDLTLLEKGGFGSVYLQSENRISFSGKIDFSVANQLRLDSPNFHADTANTTVKLAAAAVQIGNYSNATKQSDAVQTPDDKGYTATRLDVSARDLALVGNFSVNGFAGSRYASRGELHFDSQSSNADREGERPLIEVNGQTVSNPAFNGRLFNGSLRGTGAVEFVAGRLSPAIFSDFVVDLSGDANGSVAIRHASNADTLGPLMSAGGRLAFRASNITHDGRIEAPLGVIEFESPNGSITLTDRSRTSVAASAVMPFGHTTQSGKNWEFISALWDATGGSVSGIAHSVSVPIKKVSIDGKNTTIAKGAEIDLSGGGDAVAWEFTPGPGGKQDILTPQAGSEPTVFAILPGWSGNFAPADSHNLAYYNVSNPRVTESGTVYDPIPSLKPGDQIDLGSNPTGLSGKYTLLPAKYALLKGAVLVTVKPGGDVSTLSQAQAQTDGSWLVSGTRLAANADGSYSAYSSTPLTVELAPQSVVLARARYETTSATDQYYDTSDQLPGDAGLLAIMGRNQLNFDPTIRGGYVNKITHSDGRSRGGFGAQLDIAAPRIEVVDSGVAGTSGWLTLDKDSLNRLDIASLLIGGLRSVGSAGTAINVLDGSKVRVATTGEALKAGEVILVAEDEVRLKDGSSVIASGVNADAAQRNYVIEGDAGFVRVGSGVQANLTRSGTVVRNSGDVVLEGGAAVSGRALYLDATGENTLDGSMALNNAGRTAKGGSVSIGAGRINVIGDGSTPSSGLNLRNDSLTTFSGADQIRLVSYSTLDMYGNARLGDAGVKELVISASGIAGHGGNAARAGIAAQKVRFENANYASTSYVAGGALGSGKLEVSADRIEFGDNASASMRSARSAGFAVRGYDTVNLNADSELRFSGVGVTTIDNDVAFGGTGNAAALNVNAGRIVAGAGADHAIAASGKTTLTGGGNTGKVADLGGKLDWRASAMDIAGRIVTPAGQIRLQATGGDVVVRNGAYIGAEGATVKFADTEAHAGGGNIVIRAEGGDIDIRSGAIVSVSGGEGGSAGQLGLLAESGEVSAAAGTLRGKAGSKGNGLQHGELVVDANTVNVNQLADAVREGNTAHFRGGWNVRQRSGDMQLDKTLQSEVVRLAADAGSITVGSTGVIDARGSKGGEIALYAGSGNDITLKAGSRLDASATQKVTDTDNAGTRGQGGSVLLATSGSGTVVTEAGSSINVGALRDADGNKISLADDGKVTVRVERNDTELLKTLANVTLNLANSNSLSVLPGSGSAAISVSPSPAMASYQPGMVVAFTVPANTTGAVTLNVSARGAKTLLRSDGTPFNSTNKLSSGQVVVAVYDGQNFVVTSTGLTTVTGSNASTQRVNFATKPAALEAGMRVSFRASTANSADPSLILNGDNNLSAKLADANGSTLAANAYAANELVTAVYDGSKFRIVKDITVVATPHVTGSTLAGATPTLNGTVTGARSQGIEAVRVVEQHKLNNSTVAVSDFNTSRITQSAKAASLLTAAPAGWSTSNGLEVRSSGNLAVNDAVTMPDGNGYLSLRAAGDLRINASVSSGFTAHTGTAVGFNVGTSADAKLNQGGESWTYRFVAGADTAAANLLGTRDPYSLLTDASGNLTFGNDLLVRTGTGDIQLAARRDIGFGSNAAVYTAGIHDATAPDNFFNPLQDTATLTSKRNYSGTGGGDISIEAGRNLSMAASDEVDNWLARNSTSALDTQWWGRMASFRNGVGAFGGGDIHVRADGDVSNATLVTPTSGRVPRLNGTYQAELAEINGGGDVHVQTGGSISGGKFFAETGRLTLKATEAVSDSVKLMGGDTLMQVQAGTDVSIAEVYNPLGSARVTNVLSSSGSVIAGLSNDDGKVRFSTYSDITRLDAGSVNGTVSLATGRSTSPRPAPGRVKVASLQGDIVVGNFDQVPVTSGQLDLLAAEGLTINGRITQYDLAPEALFDIGRPLYSTAGNTDPYNSSVMAVIHNRASWHANDKERSRLIALNGDIRGNNSTAESNSSFNEAVQVSAGGNIEDLGITAQHARASDVTTIKAGGDILFTTNIAARNLGSQDTSFKINGPGRIEVTAGGNIDLGNRGGIITRGNLENPFLPEQGADVFVLAGSSGPDYRAFAAWARKNLKLSAAEKANLDDPAALRELFYTTLRTAGRDAVLSAGQEEKDKHYDFGRAAIAALFPKGTVGKGNIDFFYSQIKTEQGGNIDLLVPGGGVTVGIANPSVDLVKTAAEQGLFTIRGGDIRAMTRDNFLVNQSRVFTLDGGDIMVWSDRGDIDAGSGAKTVISTPPPTLVIRNGQIVLDTSSSVAGSGIGTLISKPTTPASDLDLFAPEGTIDAGDAGLRSTGNVFIGATQVLNAANIAATGTVAGAPAPVVVSIPVAAPPNPTTNAATKDAGGDALSNAGGGKQGLLTVEVLDGGEETPAPSAGRKEKDKEKEGKAG